MLIKLLYTRGIIKVIEKINIGYKDKILLDKLFSCFNVLFIRILLLKFVDRKKK